MEEDEVCELVRSVIMSEKGGVLLKNLNRDFISLAGEPIPYVKLGYKSLEEFLNIIPDVNRSVGRNGEILYNSSGKNCEHLAKLIGKQKSSKNKSSDHPKQIVSHSRDRHSVTHHGGKSAPRNSILNVGQSPRGNQQKKSFSDQKYHPREEALNVAENKLSLKYNSGAKPHLPHFRGTEGTKRNSIPPRIFRESYLHDVGVEYDDMPALVPSVRRYSMPGKSNREKLPVAHRDAYKHSELVNMRQEMDLSSCYSPKQSRDFIKKGMKLENIKVDRFSHRGSPKHRERFSLDARVSVCNRGDVFDVSRSLLNEDNQFDGKEKEESRWEPRENKFYSNDRKIDYVGGMLRITIKNS